MLKGIPKSNRIWAELGPLAVGPNLLRKSLSSYLAKSISSSHQNAKIQVKNTQRHEWAWRNEHDTGKVFSKLCTKIVSTPLSAPDPNSSTEPEPCLQCIKVFASKAFKTACSVPKPDDDNYKYINSEYRSSKLAKLMGRCLQLREIIEDKENFETLNIIQGLHLLTKNNY
jgi:hypothetical protein